MASDSAAGYAFVSVGNRSGQPGESNAPRTRYGGGHKPVPDHVRLARRRAVEIAGMSPDGGQEMYNLAEQNLRSAARKATSMAQAVNAEIGRSPSDAGDLGDGRTALAAPAGHLPWLFFGAGD